MNFNKYWYESKISWTFLLWPVELLFILLSRLNRLKNSAEQWRAPCPVVVVGNISLGGTGKSPLTISLIEYLQAQGLKVGVVSRGYGAKRTEFPYMVKASDVPSEAADEPVMIVRRTGVKLVIDPNRVRACQYLLANSSCDVIISDDGLQHYKMARDIEIAVVDGQRGLGNGHCLPVGPLREPSSRLKEVDFVVQNGGAKKVFDDCFAMHLAATGWHRVSDDQYFSLSEFSALVAAEKKQVHAYAGIGNPQRFFKSLESMAIPAKTYAFADHYQYTEQDFAFSEGDIVCMTEKDAVKCQDLVAEQSYYLKISAQLDPQFLTQLLTKINNVKKSRLAGC